MSHATLQQIERQVDTLPYNEKIDLIERLVRGLRTSPPVSPTAFEQLMAEMAVDPDIQRESAAINAEFASISHCK